MLPLVDKPIIQYGVEEAVAVRHREHHPRHRPRQERHRGSLRRLGRARDLPRGARQDRLSSARSGRSPNLINFAYVRQGEPLGLGPRRAVARSWSGTSRSPSSWRRRDRRGPAGAAADDRTCSSRWRARCWPSSASRRAGRLQLRRRRHRGSSGCGDGVLPHQRPGREAAREEAPVEPRHHRPLHPDARHLPGALRPPAVDRTGEIQLTNGLRRLLQDAAHLRATR